MNQESHKPKRKVPKWKKAFIDHKPLVVGGLIIAVAIAGIISGVVLYIGQIDNEKDTFIFGCYGGYDNIEPSLFILP